MNLPILKNKKLIMRKVFFLCLILSLTSCVSDPYSKSYSPNTQTVYNTPDIILLEEGEEPDIIQSKNLESDLNNFYSDGFVILGSSSFVDTKKKGQSSKNQAIRIGATHIILSNIYLRSESKYSPLKFSNGGSIEQRIDPATNIVRPEFTIVEKRTAIKSIYQNVAIYLAKKK